MPSHRGSDTHCLPAGHHSWNGSRPATERTESNVLALDRAPFDELRTLAEAFNDAQRTRIGLENRLRSGTVPPTVSGEVLDAQRHAESLIGRAMVRSFRVAAPDVRRWVKATPGLGEPSLARLLGAIGHPVIARPHHWEETGHTRRETHVAAAGSSREQTSHSPGDAHASAAGSSREETGQAPLASRATA